MKSLEYYSEIDAVSKIRNALVHASGILEICKNPNIIRSIIENHLYLHERDRREELISDRRYVIRLQAGSYGQQIITGPLFIWRSSGYCRDFFSNICEYFISKISHEK